jgi:cytochrome c oxidase subunit 4
MTEPHDAHDHGHGSSANIYLVIGFTLAIFTIVSFVVNGFVRGENLSALAGFFIILGVAIVKAALVAIYFMHLNHDWGKVGFMIVPAFILGAMMMFVLLPDTVLGWWADEAELVQVEQMVQKK